MSNKNIGWVASIHEFEYFKFGEHALLLEWPKASDRQTLNKITSVQNAINLFNIGGILEFVPAYHSLTIYFQPDKISHDELIEIIESIKVFSALSEAITQLITIHVNYHLSVAPDLEHVAKTLNLSVEELVRVHSAPTYDVHFIGFLPGFLYLGGLNKRLHLPRRDTPRIRVPGGSVALAGGQTGIYPFDSPGGWHIIGHTNAELFNPSYEPPCPILPGMRIKFEPV